MIMPETHDHYSFPVLSFPTCNLYADI